MKKLIGLFGILLGCYGAIEDANLSIHLSTSGKDGTRPPESWKKMVYYTIQIFTANSPRACRHLIQLLPSSLRRNTHLYQIGNYTVVRYKMARSSSSLKKDLQWFRQNGFKDAFIQKTNRWFMFYQRLDMPEKKRAYLSQAMRSRLIAQADEAYRMGDDEQSVYYYQMLYDAGDRSFAVVNNLLYLLGKRGKWERALHIAKRNRPFFRLLYAYAYGALECDHDDIIEQLGQYISLDDSGRLLLLVGSYYEVHGALKKAAKYYKLAYEKSRTNPYNIFAYARAYDMAGSYQKALYVYRMAYKRLPEDHPLYGVLKRRIAMLEE